MTEQAKPLQPVAARPLSRQVADRLRDAISNGALPLGSRLVERELADQMGVSRVPVREAIRQLAEEGLVLIEPRRGTFVYSPSLADLEEIGSLRVVLERFVVERVMARWNAAARTRLRRILAEMGQAAAAGDRQRVSALDAQFHHTLWEVADHSILREVVSNLSSRISRFLYEATISLPPSELVHQTQGHLELLNVLDSGDTAAAQDYMTAHVLGARDRVLAHGGAPRPPIGYSRPVAEPE